MRALKIASTLMLLLAIPASAGATATKIYTGTPLTEPVVSGDRVLLGEPRPTSAGSVFDLMSVGADGDQRLLRSFGAIPPPLPTYETEDGGYNSLSVQVAASSTHLATWSGRFSGWRDLPNSAESSFDAGPIGGAPTFSEDGCGIPNYGMAVDGDRLAYVSNCSGYAVRIVDLNTGATTQSIPTLNIGTGLSLKGNYVAVTGFGSADTPAATDVYDVTSGARVNSIAGSGQAAVTADGTVFRVVGYENYGPGDCTGKLQRVTRSSGADETLDGCALGHPIIDGGQIFYVHDDHKTWSLVSIDAAGRRTTRVTAPSYVMGRSTSPAAARPIASPVAPWRAAASGSTT